MLGEDIVIKKGQEPMEDRKTKLANIDQQLRAIRASRPDLSNFPAGKKQEFVQDVQIETWSMTFDQLFQLANDQQKERMQRNPYREFVIRKKDLDDTNVLTIVFRKFENEYGKPTGITDEIIYFQPNKDIPQVMLLFHIDAQKGSVASWKGNFDEEKVTDASLEKIHDALQIVLDRMEFVHPPQNTITRRYAH